MTKKITETLKMGKIQFLLKHLEIVSFDNFYKLFEELELKFLELTVTSKLWLWFLMKIILHIFQYPKYKQQKIIQLKLIKFHLIIYQTLQNNSNLGNIFSLHDQKKEYQKRILLRIWQYFVKMNFLPKTKPETTSTGWTVIKFTIIFAG